MMNKVTPAVIQTIIAPALTALGYELWGCEVHPHGHRTMLRVYIDSEQGITVADCIRATRQMNAVLNVEHALADQYELEVSSPGLDRPLFTPDQYQRFVGRQVRIRLHVPQQERRQYVGILQGIEAGQITLIIEGTAVILSLANVEKANLVPNG
ncbi:MAG: ribosome maturation factor RimP [Gammaproteobacteria bacterium]